MTDELKALIEDLNAVFFRYAHITGVLELYFMVLENPNLQRAFSKVVSGSEIEWKEIHRFMVVDGKTVTWYPELPVQTILAQKNTLLGYLYGITLSRLIGDLDFYLGSILQNHLQAGYWSNTKIQVEVKVVWLQGLQQLGNRYTLFAE